MESAGKGARRSGGNPGGTLGSVADAVGTAADADKLAVAQTFVVVPSSVAEVAAAVEVAAAAFEFAAAAPLVGFDSGSVVQGAPADTVAARAESSAALDELPAVKTAAGGAWSAGAAAESTTAAEHVVQPPACCLTGCLTSAGSSAPLGWPSTPPQ